MYNKSHALREMYEFYHDREKALAESANEELKEKETEVQEFIAQLDKYRKQRELKDSELGKFTEAVYDNHMQTALEAIYISALQKVSPLSEESEEIAKSLVEKYIKENGGAREIIRTRSGKTFLLDTIFEAVDSAAQRDIELFFEAKDDDEKEDKKEKEKKDDEPEADGSEEVDKEDIKLGDADGDGVDDAQDSDYGTGSDNDKNEEASDSKEDSDEKEDKEDEKKEDEEAKEDDDKEEKSEDEEDSKEDDSESEEDNDDEESADVEDLDKEEVEDDEEEEAPAEDPDLDEPDTAETVAASQEEPPVDPEEEPEVEEVPTSKEELFDKLEDSEDVKDAVDIIAKRISDAETKFIEKNSEDKKKIENIVNKMQDRLDAVTQDEDSTPEDIEAEQNEAKLEATRLTNEIRNDRFHTVYELMVRDNLDYIHKNQTLSESYKVDGKIDMTRVMDNSRAMYGWLETVNTIQLDKVDERYIQNMIDENY